MKFPYALLLFVAVFLAVSTEGVNAEEASHGLKPVADAGQRGLKLSFQNYQLVEDKPSSESAHTESKLRFQDYQLVEDKPASESADVERKEPEGPEPYRRICLIVRCAPNWSKWQICRCILWKKYTEDCGRE